YQYGISRQLCRQNGLLQAAQKLLPTWANCTRQLHSNVEATTPSWQMKSARDSTPHTATISPLIAAVSASAFDPATRGEDTTSRLSKEARKRQTISSVS